jgi:hypothetical protein
MRMKAESLVMDEESIIDQMMNNEWETKKEE